MTIQLAQLRLSLTVSTLALALFGTGCDIKDEEIGNDPPGSGNSGAAQGSGGAGGSSSEGGAGGNGAGGHGGASCEGDPAAFAEAIQPLPCSKNSDCCVVLNSCSNEAQIVHASKAAVAKASWATCIEDCTDCIPPDVDVYCIENVCVGRANEATGEFPVDHCGVDEEPGAGGGTGEHFSCGGG